MDAETAFLDKIIKKQQEEAKTQGKLVLSADKDSVLKMDRKNFNYKKELK